MRSRPRPRWAICTGEILRLFLQRLELMERQMGTLNESIGKALHQHHEAVRRLVEVPGLCVNPVQTTSPKWVPQPPRFHRLSSCPPGGHLSRARRISRAIEERFEIAGSRQLELEICLRVIKAILSQGLI